MTEVPAEPHSELHSELRPELRNWCEVWNTCVQNVLAQVSGQPLALALSLEPLSPADSDVWYTVAAEGAIRGEMTLRLSAASGARLARKFLSEPEPAAEAAGAGQIAPDQKEALEELLRQIAGLAATALAATVGGEVKLHLAASAAPSWSSDAIVCLRTGDEGAVIALEIRLSPALAAALQTRAQTATAASSQASPAAPSSPEPAPSASYRRLMDVGLGVKLRFGTRRMLLRDVLALSAGVVVELESHLHSPVDLLLDGRLIAQGEVVIVDGKYGLRVTSVVDPAPGSPG